MRALTILIVIFLSGRACAQTVHLEVIDFATKIPIAKAEVTYGNLKLFSGEDGKLSLEKSKLIDQVTIIRIGYRSQTLNLNNLQANPVLIYLKTEAINLSEVNINARRNYLRDSLKIRSEYKSVFAYQAPKFYELLVPDKGYRKLPNPNMVSNSTSSIVSFDLLKLAGLLTKNKNPTLKLQKVLLKDEERNYVDSRFSPKRVSSITQLQGDSLRIFIDRYRPSIMEIKKMNDYELLNYVKSRYIEFRKEND